MIGAHLDSWHVGTGATDNASGVASVLEAMRILKVIGATPRRTIRAALWGYEEGGFRGSRAYVAQHFGSPSVGTTDDYEKFSGYFNLDNGTGQIRGVHQQGNPAVATIFDEWMQPFHDLNVRTLSTFSNLGSDQLAFDEVGLPGFQFLQDRIEYRTRTHHTNMDVFEKLLPGDLKINAVVLGGVRLSGCSNRRTSPAQAVQPGTAWQLGNQPCRLWTLATAATAGQACRIVTAWPRNTLSRGSTRTGFCSTSYLFRTLPSRSSLPFASTGSVAVGGRWCCARIFVAPRRTRADGSRNIIRRALSLSTSTSQPWTGRKTHNRAALGGASRRVDLRHQDVRTVTRPKADVIQAFNFSSYLFNPLPELLTYFRCVRRSLAPGGIFMLDGYGGWDSQQILRERRTVKSASGTFGYVWDQADFNPIDSRALCHIHFEFKNQKRWKRAFTYPLADLLTTRDSRCACRDGVSEHHRSLGF